jgi:hypothetical protein
MEASGAALFAGQGATIPATTSTMTNEGSFSRDEDRATPSAAPTRWVGRRPTDMIMS